MNDSDFSSSIRIQIIHQLLPLRDREAEGSYGLG